MSTQNNHLVQLIQGTWWLISREDYTKNGQKRVDPILGPEPVAILVYTSNHFAAQFMKKDRSPDSITPTSGTRQNNTATVGGYDAYFGTFQVDAKTNLVAHTLIGSINPANIGMKVERSLKVEHDQLIIQLETNTQEGEPVTRTLKWERIK